MAGLPLLVIEHPLGGERPDAVARRSQQALEQLAALIAGGRPAAVGAGGASTLRDVGGLAEKGGAPTRAVDGSEPDVLLDDDPFVLLAEFSAREWCDGLPFIAPTPERVAAMLGGRNGSTSLGAVPPLWRQATIEKLAINAVMAGCEPAAFPIVLAAVEALLDPAFNLYGVQATTHPVAPLLVVNGAYGRRVGLHYGSGCFGPGFRANATIGRAIRLILLNVGGAWPGRYDMATQGSPAKYAYCIAEHEEASPWGPLRDGDTVTVYGGEGPHNVNDHVSTTASGILTNVADTAVSLGSNVGWYFSQAQLMVVLGPEHARTIAGDGFTRADVQRYVFENARQPLSLMRLGGMYGMQDWPAWMNATTDPDARLPRVPSPDDVFVVVAGGSGKHSAIVPNCTFSRAVSRPIRT
ncbi:MAG TPA: hypothetical protein VFW70_22080 [Methylomirabilota bacterium]|nr:hypothetical protein [Methylomirabilota bacterium]